MTSFQHGFALLFLATSGLTAIACGDAGTDTSGSGGTGAATTSDGGSGGGGQNTGGQNTGGQNTGGQTTGGQNTCDPLPPISYDDCSGNTFFPDGSCEGGACATVPLETRVFDAWKARAKALSGLSDSQFAERVKISKISHTDGPQSIFVRIDYVIVLDWARARQADSAQFDNMPLQNPPTDAQVDSAVKFAIQDTEWTGLGAISQVVSESAMQDGFAQCECDVDIHPCDNKFQNVTGKFLARGFKVIDAAQNQCKRVAVNLATGELDECLDEPCEIN